ncbi:stress response translation initiation inhibitor YciH [Candidatus Woesearchaeota archaeon]|jgi:translation initiation factor 1|nr:stress response translation initiation inhibitor YciH [Candidatus Woesearchaeota archaeon]MBT4835205.1 stress response translation initiation inhibitor YciH [Candidatus Woesearchaeota archaeon]MBT6734920.1 stress response translation initiation inhibitor YciH [Candidatus Woesearchaeota archaeon]MBT7169565.1 stress response translation initiation inhibitor YciH [Candidatus Woesearchaeota archaeon]MBT7474523.1 stress response translation initiation inhibitor YciH [Candidatus Woesearchaeota arc
MTEICSTCGLPDDLCVCETIAKEDQSIRIKKEKKRYGKIMTLIEGIDKTKIDIKDVSKKLKSKFACGGTVKDSIIELQGDHNVEKIKEELVKLGFNKDSMA